MLGGSPIERTRRKEATTRIKTKFLIRKIQSTPICFQNDDGLVIHEIVSFTSKYVPHLLSSSSKTNVSRRIRTFSNRARCDSTIKSIPFAQNIISDLSVPCHNHLNFKILATGMLYLYECGFVV
jgi:hypothetical protein